MNTFKILPVIIIITVFSCNEKASVKSEPIVYKDTILRIDWNIVEGDTISGSAIRVVNGDTFVEDIGMNPNLKIP